MTVLALLLAVIVSATGLVSCSSGTTEAPESGPRAWIDFPRNGVTIPVGARVVVVSHANARDGISEVLLSVNGTALRRDPTTEPGETLVEFRQEWVPADPGLTTLEVRAYTASGQASGADVITVVVEGEATAAPTPEPTTPEPTTPEPTTQPPTTAPTTQPPTTTPPAPAPTTPTTRTPTTTPAPPPTTPPPTQPPDVTPPPVPVPAVPANGLTVTCRSSQTLAWLPVTDPSGVTYAVKLERQITATTWESVRVAGMIAAKQYDVPVQCGGIYRWTVRARDNAGNQSAWSAYSYFSVDLG